ncbi:MAG: LptF/LptG family permease, partial [Pseudomonadota bacterium]
MWIFSRYIIFEFLKRFLPFLFILVILFIGIDLLSKIWSINTSISNIAAYYFFRAPGIIVQMIPVSILLGTLLLFSYLAKHNELVALYTSGRSLLRIGSPMFLVISAICVFSFYFSDRVLPITNFQAQKIWMVDILGRGSEFFGTLHHQKAWFRDKGKIYNIYSYDSASNTASGVNVYEFNELFEMTKHLSAKYASYNKNTRLWT